MTLANAIVYAMGYTVIFVVSAAWAVERYKIYRQQRWKKLNLECGVFYIGLDDARRIVEEAKRG